MNKKICYITTMPGTMGFFTDQLLYLNANGFDITVICSYGENVQEKLGMSIRYIPVEIPRGISFFGSVRAIKDLTRVFKEQQFDLIQYSTPNAAFYASIAAKVVGCKVRNYHLMGFRYLGASGIGRNVLKILEKVACQNSTFVECVSKSNMEMGIKEGFFPPEKVTVVWNGSSGGVDLSRFDYAKREKWRSEVRKKLGCSETDFVYGFAGRITRDKGINELLEAFFRLNTGAKLCMIGRLEEDQTLDAELIKKAKTSRNVVFHDFVNDIERYYAAFDVLILPSYREGFGNVVIEAAAMGTPAIVSDIPGPTDAIDRDKTALVVKAKDVDSLCEAMKQIQQGDYIGMGKNAAAFAREKYDSKIMSQKILERKQNLLSEI